MRHTLHLICVGMAFHSNSPTHAHTYNLGDHRKNRYYRCQEDPIRSMDIPDGEKPKTKLLKYVYEKAICIFYVQHTVYRR